MNTAARIESCSEGGCVLLSQETSELLTNAGKGHWFEKRDDKVKAKGELQTYWLDVSLPCHWDKDEITECGDFIWGEEKLRGTTVVYRKEDRLIDWNVEHLHRLLKEVSARRKALGLKKMTAPELKNIRYSKSGSTVLEEVKEVIALPEFDPKAAREQEDPQTVELHPTAVAQLHDYVVAISYLYHDNAFHNFDHASHVTMSVIKLLSRIVFSPPTDHKGTRRSAMKNKRQKAAANMHDNTYGITSDPLTQFACVFSALIHDVDHRGVPNGQLAVENLKLATLYKNKSLAEQNSVDLAWDLLMDDRYSELRKAIYCNESEQKRFRSLVVNAVMATDIMDRDLKNLRNARWDKAFNENVSSSGIASENLSSSSHGEKSLHGEKTDTREDINRKATIVIEHLMQASDVAHTMQHWHIYRKWNERLFQEMYSAYKSGRAETDPSTFWYKGEIGFFDYYIIPLAKKVKDCGVFGVSSDEYLNYAMQNRDEWTLKGESIVAEMVQKKSKLFMQQKLIRQRKSSNASGA